MPSAHGKNTLGSISSLQLVVADMYSIPRKQAHTVNAAKVRAYHSWCRSDECRLEKFLDSMERQRAVAISQGRKYVETKYSY